MNGGEPLPLLPEVVARAMPEPVKGSGAHLYADRREALFLEPVVVRQNQPIRLDRLVSNFGFCAGLLFAGNYDLLGTGEDALG